jgi:hypothetical protein
MIMKKFAIVTFFIWSAMPSNAKNKIEGSFYGTVATSIWNHFSINQTLSNNDLKTVNLVMPSAGLGTYLKYKKFRVGVGFNFMTGRGKADQSSYKFNAIPLDFNLGYDVLKISDWSVSAGLIMAYIPTSLELYTKEGLIDMSNINPSVQPGLIKLYNSFFLLGTYLGIDLFPGSDFPIKVTVSYEFNLNSAIWKSEYATLANAPGEDGNRLLIKVILPFTTWSD